MQLAHPKVAQLKPKAFRPQVCHGAIDRPARMPESPLKSLCMKQRLIMLVFVIRPTKCTGRAKACDPDVSGGSKNASGSVGISQKKGRHRRQAINLTPPRKVKTWGDPPLRLEEIKPPVRIPDSAKKPLREADIWRTSHQTDEYRTKPFLGGSGLGAVAQTHPAVPKMPRAPSAFPLKSAPKVPGNKPNPSKEG